MSKNKAKGRKRVLGAMAVGMVKKYSSDIRIYDWNPVKLRK